MSNYKNAILWGATITFGTSVIYGLRFLYHLVFDFFGNQPIFTESHRNLFVIAISSFALFLNLWSYK
jgi:hypothetical protein